MPREQQVAAAAAAAHVQVSAMVPSGQRIRLCSYHHQCIQVCKLLPSCGLLPILREDLHCPAGPHGPSEDRC